MKIIDKMKLLVIITLFISLSNCSKSSSEEKGTTVINPPEIKNEVDFWLTKSDESVKIEKQATLLAFNNTYNYYAIIEVNESQKSKTIDGFRFSLTGGSAEVINRLDTDKKQELL